MPEATTTPPSDTATGFASQTGDSPDHVQRMLDKVEGTPAPEPAWAQVVPEKFRAATPEETLAKLAKSYGELEKRLSGSTTPPEATSPPTPTVTPTPTDGGALDTASITEEVRIFGKVSEETIAKYAARGIPRSLVEGYAQGIQAIAQQVVTEVHSVVGGDKTYSDMLSWAKSNLSPEEIDSYDADVTSGDKGRVLRAVRGLHAIYKGSRPSVPNFVTGDAGNPVAGSGFDSRAQMTEAMRDPRYKKDPAYRNQIEARLKTTDFSLLR